MIVLETILEEVLRVFKAEGIDANTDEVIVRKLDIERAALQELFSNRAQMVREVVLFDLEQQKKEHTLFLASANNPIEEIMLLLQDGIKNMKSTSPQYYREMQQGYPSAWQLMLDHLNTFSYHEVSNIINRGIIQGLFRKDINLQLVTKIILEQVVMLLNPNVFPPERYNLGEVFRSMFLYYVRGICTEAGGKLAEEYFAKNNI